MAQWQSPDAVDIARLGKGQTTPQTRNGWIQDPASNRLHQFRCSTSGGYFPQGPVTSDAGWTEVGERNFTAIRSPRQTPNRGLKISETPGFAASRRRDVKLSAAPAAAPEVANKSQQFPVSRKSGASITRIAGRRRSELLQLACFDRKRKNAEGFFGGVFVGDRDELAIWRPAQAIADRELKRKRSRKSTR